MSTTKAPMQLVAITVVPAGLGSTPGNLGTPTIKTVHRRVTDYLAKAKVHMAIGVLEVSLSEHQQNRYPRAWMWQLHGLALTRNPDALADRLTKAFPRTDAVPRPVHVEPWDGRTKWLQYCHKIDRRCRIGVDDEVQFDPRKQKARKCRTTTRRSLTPDELLELLLFHDQISLDSRILTKGAQLRMTKDGCRIVKLRRPRRKC